MILSTDSTANLPTNLYTELNIQMIPMQITIDDNTFDDLSNELNPHEFYNKLRTGHKATTAQINEYSARTYFENLLKQNEDIIHISFSSGLSGGTATIKRVAQELNSNHKNKIAVIDSLNGGMGEGLLVLLAENYIKQGLTFDEIKEKLTLDAQRCCSYFTVDHLKYLVRGGRISKLKGTIGSVLKIKPIIKADENGKLVDCKKTITRKLALNELFKIVCKNIVDKNYLFIGHTDCLTEAEKLAERFEKELGITPVIGEITQVLGSHCGPDTIAVFFIGEKR